jgi:hypothetical protein
MSPSPSPVAFALHYMDGVCPLAGAKPVTFKIDPLAPEPVLAIDDRGAALRVWWPTGFLPGTAADPVVRDQAGQVVAYNGERLVIPENGFPKLHGYSVCFGDGIYVLLNGP